MNYENYKNKMKYPKKPAKPKVPTSDIPQDYLNYAIELERWNDEVEKYKEKLIEYRACEKENMRRFKEDALRDVGLILNGVKHPKADKVFDMAWEEGYFDSCSDGLYLVRVWLGNLTDLILE